jgi:hypothetical protein
MVEPFADTAGRSDRALLAVDGCPPHRRAPRSHGCRRSGRRCGTRGHRRGTPDVHTRTLDSGRVDIAYADTGWSHRTPDTGHRTPDAWTRGRVDATSMRTGDQGTGRHPDRHPGPPRPPDRPLGRRTVDLWTAPTALGNDDGSAPVRYLPARDHLPHYQAPARSLRRPSRALAHCCRVLDLDGTRGGQWDYGKVSGCRVRW